MGAMKIDGTCHCGALSYEADIDPANVLACHCEDCQSISGAPFRWTVNVPEENFKLLSGTPKAYVKIGESGRASRQLFCPDCASPLYAMADGDGPKVLRLRLGTCRQRAALVPRLEVWRRSAQSWLIIDGDTTKIAKQPKL